MKLYKPKFWDNKISFLAIILFPLSLIFIFVTHLNRKISKRKVFKLPIICVGNIYLGGTGKTPTSIFLARELSKLGKKAVILRKYYKSHTDEYKLIKNSFKNLIINKNRADGINDAEKNGFDFVILDDGLQDHRINKNIKIVCFNSNQLIGNGLVFPAGPLRERLNSIKDADIIIINGKKNFLVCAWNNKIKNIVIKNKIKGILFPDKIIPARKIIKKIGIKYLEKVFEIFL